MRALALAGILALIVAGLAVASASAPRPTAPKAGATLPVGAPVTFKARSAGKGTHWVYVSRSKKRRKDGTIGREVAIGKMKRGKNGTWSFRQRVYQYPEFWLMRGGTYYWQVHRISCENGSSDCRIEGPVRTLRIR